MACLDKSYRGRNEITTVMAWEQKKMAMTCSWEQRFFGWWWGDSKIKYRWWLHNCGFTNNYYIIYFVVNILWYMKTYQKQANELQSDVSKLKRFTIVFLYNGKTRRFIRYLFKRMNISVIWLTKEARTLHCKFSIFLHSNYGASQF